MAALPNRFTQSDVVRYNAPEDELVTGAARYQLDDLSGGELRTVCAALFGARNVPNATKDARLMAIRENDPEYLTIDAPQERTVRPTATTTTTTQETPAVPTDLVLNAPPTTDTLPMDLPPTIDKAKADALAVLLAPTAAPFDEAAVRRIIEESNTDTVAYLTATIEERIGSAATTIDKLEAGLAEQLPALIDEAIKALRPTVVQVNTAPQVQMDGHVHKAFDKVLRLVAAGTIPYLVGPAGTGKSTLARQIAKALNVSCATLPCEPTMSTVKLMGYMDASGRYVRTEFRDAVEKGGVFLLDEIDASHPAVVKGFNEALATPKGGYIAFPDGMVKVHDEFYAIAAANTFGLGASRQYVGASQLDASTLDRFAYVEIGYDEELERTLAAAIGGSAGEGWAVKVHKVRANQVGNDLRVVVSTRAVEKGARMVAAGFTEAEAFEAAIGLAHDRTTVEKLTKGVAFAS